MSVVGFDFGNLYSVIAVARKRGIDVLQNEVGHRVTPSMVAFNGKQRFIGNEAMAQAMSNPKNTIKNIKRLVGRKHDEPDIKRESELVSFKIVPHSNGSAAVQVNYDDQQQVFAPEQVTGALFQKLKEIAESGLDGAKVSDCVIGVPNWWSESHRRAMLDAANIAGLNVLRLMNESTAVALQWGILRPLTKDQELKVMFIDIGHSQTQVSLVSFTEGKLTVLATAADRHLGGRDFDEVLVKHFHKYILEKYKMDVFTEVKATAKLRKECERVKLHLSANTKVQFAVEYIMNDRDVSGQIDRSEFEALCAAELLPRLLVPVQQVLAAAKVDKSQLHCVEVVGGSVRIPCIQKSISNFFDRDLSKTCDGDESVARGCTLMCAMLSPSFKVKEFEVHDVTPYAIDLQWGPVPAAGQPFQPDDSTTLFSVNNAMPSVKLISFNDRSEPFQLVARYTDPSVLPTGTDPVLGRFIVSGMPAKQEGKKVPKIKVRVKLNLHGIISVTSAQMIEEVEEEVTPSPPPAAAAPAQPQPASDAAPMETDEQKPAGDAAAAPKPDSDKMETDEQKPAEAAPTAAAPAQPAAAAAPPAKKIKVRREDLKVESFLNNGADQKTLNAFFEKEVAMATQDRSIHETNQARNDLEAYVLDMRSRLQGDLAPYMHEADKDAFLNRLNAEEEWLYNDGFDCQKSEYKKRLADLRATGDLAVHRLDEHHHRDTHVAALKSAIGHYSQWAATRDEKHAHITDEERHKVVAECTAVDQWLAQVLSAQDRLTQADPPAVTCVQLKQKKTELDQAVLPIMQKPKPAPPKPKAEEKKAEDKKPEASSPNANANAGAAGADANGAASPSGDASKPDADAGEAKPMEQ